MSQGKGIQIRSLPIKFKLSDRLQRQANLVGTETSYTAELLDEIKKTVLIKFKGKQTNAATIKFTELNRNIKKGDWIVID